MNRPIFVLLLSSGLCAIASPQRGGLQHVQPGGMQPAGRIEAAKHQLQLDPPLGPNAQKLDPAKLRQERDEFTRLAQSVSGDLDQVARGKLPKDMADKLKRIEKLSKRLRSELTP